MLNRLRKLLGKATEGHGLHAPFHVTTHHGHIVQTFLSLEAALEAAKSLDRRFGLTWIFDRMRTKSCGRKC